MHGVSCHSFGALETAAKTDWVQVDLARINPAGVQMDAPPERIIPILREMKASGKAVIGMKIFGAGERASRADECLEFAQGLDCVDAFTIGCRARSNLLTWRKEFKQPDGALDRRRRGARRPAR